MFSNVSMNLQIKNAKPSAVTVNTMCVCLGVDVLVSVFLSSERRRPTVDLDDLIWVSVCRFTNY